MSTLATSNLKNASATNPNIVLNSDGTIGGDCLTQTCRAWVNFNGTGVVAIRASYNVSSITDDGVGKYTVNFTTAMPDANYSAVVDGAFDTSDSIGTVLNALRRQAFSSSSVGVRTFSPTDGTFNDGNIVCVAIFR